MVSKDAKAKKRDFSDIPIKTVLPSTAGQPPPSERSSTIGSVSLVITLLSSSVTRTQCFPRCNSFRTLAAFLRSEPSPEV